MTSVVISHAVGNMETWLAGSENRKRVFANFCSSHRIFTHPDANRVSIVCEDVDLAKMEATLGTPETEAAKAQDTVIDPVDLFVEVEGGH